MFQSTHTHTKISGAQEHPFNFTSVNRTVNRQVPCGPIKAFTYSRTKRQTMPRKKELPFKPKVYPGPKTTEGGRHWRAKADRRPSPFC